MHAWCGCSSVSTVELQTVIDEVEQQEKAGSIQPLPEDDTPTSILEAEPEAGQIVSRKEYPVLGVVELTLSNGMKVETEPAVHCPHVPYIIYLFI